VGFPRWQYVGEIGNKFRSVVLYFAIEKRKGGRLQQGTEPRVKITGSGKFPIHPLSDQPNNLLIC